MIELYNSVSQKTSKLITNEYSTSFSFSSMLLSKNIRPAIYSIYGLVRLADEIVDSFHSYNKADLLKKLKRDYSDAINDRISVNPVLNSFQDVYHRYNFEPDLVESFFNSMEMDLDSRDYDQRLYSEYIYGSAEVVGLMCLKVFVNGDQDKYERLKESAKKLGAAFQKVNFLRDMEYDNNLLGRTYFPDIDFSNITDSEKNKIISEIEKDFDDSLYGIKNLDRDSFLGVYVAYKYYRELLNKIKRVNLSRLKEERIRISNFKKARLVLNSAIMLNIGLLKL